MLLPKRVTTLLVERAKPVLSLAQSLMPDRVKDHLLKSVLVKKAKPALSVVHKVVPATLQKKWVLQGMKQLSKEFLKNGEMDFMEGKVAHLHVKDMNISYFFTLQDSARKVPEDKSHSASFSEKKLVILPEGNRKGSLSTSIPNVTFSATLEAFVLLASQKVDPDTLFFNRSLQISGDTELGLEIKNLIDQFDIQLLHKPVGQILNVWSQQLLESQHA